LRDGVIQYRRDSLLAQPGRQQGVAKLGICGLIHLGLALKGEDQRNELCFWLSKQVAHPGLMLICEVVPQDTP